MPLCTPPPAFLVADSEDLMLKEKTWKQAKLRIESRFIHLLGLGNYANRNRFLIL